MKNIGLLLLFLAGSLLTQAQKLTVSEGNFDFLKDQKSINVEFRYDQLKLMKENKSEGEYVSERVAELNAKTAGSGDTWKKRWEGSRESVWEANFLDLLAKTATAKKGIVFGQGLKDARYTLIVDALWIYPGWDAGVMKQPAKVTTNLSFVEKGKPVLIIKSENAPGDQWGSNFSNESRIGEGFEKTAKTLGNRIVKEVK